MAVNQITKRSATLLRLCILLASLAATGANAEDKQKNTVSPETFKALNKARELSDTSRFQEAVSLLKAHLPKVAGNRYEAAMINQYLAYAYLEDHRNAQAMTALEAALQGADTLPADSVQNLRYNLAQVAMQTGKYEKAAAELDKWFPLEKNPSADAWYMRGLAYYKLSRFKQATAPLKKAIALSAHEDWYVLLLSIYLEQKQYRDAISVLNQLLSLYPSKREYWMNLVDAQLILKDYDKALATLILVHHRFDLEEKDLLRLAQLYMHQNIPYSAAKLLTQMFKTGRIGRSAANMELLANSWALAREHEKELEVLKQVAAMKNDGASYLRCAHIQLKLTRWKEAMAMLDKSLATGNLKNPEQAHLLMGIAAFNAGNAGRAVSAFTEAGKYRKTKGQAARWLQQVNAKKHG